MNEYQQLKTKLIAANKEYYVSSNPILSDYEFDMELKRLEAMEKAQGFADPDSPTQKPGSDLSNSSISNKHRRPMLSLENTYNDEDVTKWYNDMRDAAGDSELVVVVQPKFDGGSAAITFKDGRVIKALTRGDGTVGEDITQNVKLLDWSKINKEFSGEVRGELIMTKEGFAELNKDGKYQNARNLLSGSMKLLDPAEFALRAPYIKFYAYWLEDSKNDTYLGDMMDIMAYDGFQGPEVMHNAHNLKELLEGLSLFEDTKNSFSYDIDGAVMKVNDKKLWKQLGSTAKFPRWAKAFKFKQENIETTVNNITFEVGRTGKITPLAWFEPVFIDGSTVQKATLNNKEFYESMDVAIGDTVTVQKAAAIIPQIIGVKRNPEREKVEFPKVCPCCGTTLAKHNEEHADLYCDNVKCKARIVDGIVNYTHALEIDGFAQTLVERLYNAGFLMSIADLYELKQHKNSIATLDRMSDKIIDKMCDNIETQKKAELWKFLTGLGIVNVGPKMAKTLAARFRDIDSLMAATETGLMSIPDVAEVTAKSIYEYFKNPENKQLIETLRKAGQNMRNDEVSSGSDKLTGKSICITGALSKPRAEIEKLIEDNGGSVASGVSKKTSFLLTNEPNSGSSKNKKATELGIKIISENEFYKMLK